MPFLVDSPVFAGIVRPVWVVLAIVDNGVVANPPRLHGTVINIGFQPYL